MPSTSEPDPILLSVFENRFMSIASAMGEALRRTCISVNLRERLDYSCGVFDFEGNLVSHAPHIPIHIGAMAEATRWQVEHLTGSSDSEMRMDVKPPEAVAGEGLQPGDAILTNSPQCGGSHLPDVTVVSPVFDKQGKNIIFFVTNRGHHADVGGSLPGSMPPTSKNINDEGAHVKSFKVLKAGHFDEEGLRRLFCDVPAQYEGCSGSRAWGDNLSDVKAQLAANHKGAQLIGALIEECGLELVQEYMRHIRDNADKAVRKLLRDVAKRHGTNKLSAKDHMDDGTPIELNVTIDAEKGEAIFDFTGTGSEVLGNHNAPRSITTSAVVYALRAMVNTEIPLNAGCLAPVTIRLPKNSLLSPSSTAAVVGGNVMTSQRVIDVVLRAFEASAASQGCCNNLTFGLGGKDGDGNVVQGFGYYETIAGGHGAGPTWNGHSGVHTNATNTRITDPEIFERRYPVVLRQFSLRPGSGGAGLHPGGDGVIRDIEVLPPVMSVSILSERRSLAPFGMHGGGDGQRGENLWVKKRREADGDWIEGEKDGGPPRVISLGGKATTRMGAGDRIVIMTPGGGAWGAKSDKMDVDAALVDGDEASAKKRKAVVHDLRKGSVADREALALGQ